MPRGLIPLAPPAATTFGTSAEIHDLEAPPKPGDANDAYASAFALVAQQPLTDVKTTVRQARVVAHQATSGAQTRWDRRRGEISYRSGAASGGSKLGGGAPLNRRGIDGNCANPATNPCGFGSGALASRGSLPRALK